MKFMFTPYLPALALGLILSSLVSCKRPPEEVVEVEIDPAAAADTPVMKVEPGQRWRYRVTIENPKDRRSGGPVDAQFERERTYLGKIAPTNDKPAVDCFEVVTKDAATVREFVKIEPGSVSLLGQSVAAGGGETSVVWFAEPIPFFRAGLQAGDSLPLVLLDKTEKLWRVIRVISREKVTVPAGEFDTVRLQMVGRDGEVALRKTYWYSPGTGLVREERVREIENQPVLVETEELIARSGGDL